LNTSPMDIRSLFKGAWRVIRLLQAGSEEPREPEDRHFLWITDDVIITGNADAAWDMPYVLRGETFPLAIDVTRNDRWEPWVELAILDVQGDTLQICTAGSATGARPDEFVTSADDERQLYVAVRCNEPMPE
jgi:uncharacterized protein (TIGR03067 family)